MYLFVYYSTDGKHKHGNNNTYRYIYKVYFPIILHISLYNFKPFIITWVKLLSLFKVMNHVCGISASSNPIEARNQEGKEVEMEQKEE